MIQQLTILLVHGFWGGAAHWSRVIVELTRLGFTELRAVELPLTSLADDAERTYKMISQIGGPVLLVGHSYGGIVITEAGNHPNVVGLVYVAAFAPDRGESASSLTHYRPPVAIANIVRDEDGYLWIKPALFRACFCGDLSPEEGLVMAVTQKAPRSATFGDIVSEPAWKTKPSWYQISAYDRMIHPENQRLMAARLNARKVITLEASHAALVSQPVEIAALIAEAARHHAPPPASA